MRNILDFGQKKKKKTGKEQLPTSVFEYTVEIQDCYCILQILFLQHFCYTGNNVSLSVRMGSGTVDKRQERM